MATSLYTPGEDGVRASIWAPGGAIEDEAAACDLLEDPEIANDSYLFHDNFSGTDGLTLDGRVSDSAHLWELLDGTVSILDGALVGGTGESNFETETLTVAGHTLAYMEARIAFFEEQDATLTLRLGIPGTNVISLAFSRSGATMQVSAGYQDASSTDSTEPATLDFCTYYTVRVTADASTGDVALRVDDVLIDTLEGTAFTYLAAGTLVWGVLNQDAANTIRLAALTAEEVGI